jgi:hypothetical protein
MGEYDRQDDPKPGICGPQKGPSGHLADVFSGLADAFFHLVDTTDSNAILTLCQG